MKIVADANIPYAESAFGRLGRVKTLPSEAITAEAVRDAEILLVRSTIQVGPQLLESSRVRFVATATGGFDHLDTAWLTEAGIEWASAPGCNAGSVAQWFASALLTFGERTERPLEGLTVGIIGVGHVGRQVEAVARALGCRVLRNDPPRSRAEGDAGFVPLDTLCAESDIVTLHVPLTVGGHDPTAGLVDETLLARLRPGAWVVNASRGPVLDGEAAAAARESGALGGLLLDVFAGEPAIPTRLVERADIATPHIAGHSLDGKAAGTETIYHAVCAFLGARREWAPAQDLPPLPVPAMAVDAEGRDDGAVALSVLRRFYSIEADDAALREISRLPDDERGQAFQRYRDGYPARREPRTVRLRFQPERPRAAALLAALGAQPES